ncbi:hypothetical protein F511_31535 [Dorcoceras hygrometricum]|uniref:Uncharacterized protein n=1 Tax=Dorcoceras hygrometricum TaxID=472368 RepID=A0A2Z7BFE0_9LAMI|nr:hypothetical protein F511_31535 [Dorcoceras hygrometricum]
MPVPAGSSFLFSACSWLSSFQLIYCAPAGSTWPPPDYEQLIQLWTSPLLIQLPSKCIALQRRRYILLNYREVLLRKFLEVRQMNFKPSEGSSAIDLKILDQLYDIHLFILEELKKEIQAHDLMWKKTCCSKIFEGRPRDRGAVIARTNSNTPSKCWIRTMLRTTISVFLAAFPTYSIRVPRVTLSIQTRYTPTASKVDNDKQIPQLLSIVLRRCSNIVVLQQMQESAVITTISVLLAAFPTYSIRVPRVMLSIQTKYTPTAVKVDNDKQIPQLLSIVLRRWSNIVDLQQTQESAVVITSRNNRNPVAT